MRADKAQLLRNGASSVDIDKDYVSKPVLRGWCAAQTVIIALTLALSSLLLIWISIHTNTFDDLSSNHLSNSEYNQITSDTLRVSSLNAQDDPDNRIVFASPVVFEGAVTAASGPVAIRSVLNTEFVEVVSELLVEIPINGTTTVNVQTLIDRIEQVRGQCGTSGDAEALFDTLAEFLEYIILEESTDIACLEAAESLLVEMQEINTATTTNHTMRLDTLEAGNCSVSSEVATSTFELTNLDANMTALNITIVSTDVALVDIRDILDGILLDLPSLENVTCVFNETTLNATVTTLQDFRTQLTDSQGFLNASETASATCSATMLTIVTVLDTYETALNSANATYANFFELFAGTSGNLSALQFQHTALQITVSNNNVTFGLYTTEFGVCSSTLAALQTQVDDLWSLYSSLVTTLNEQQTLYESYENQFNLTYTLFNSSARDCDAELQLYNDLLTSFNTLSLQYETDYLNILNVINDANAQLLNVTALEAALSALEANVTSMNITVSGFGSIISAVNTTLQQIDTNLIASEQLLNNTGVVLVQANTTAVSLAATATAINATLQQLDALVTNQTARLAEHNARLQILEGFVCPTLTMANYVGENYIAAQNLTSGELVVLNSVGQIVLASGLFIKHAFEVDSNTFDTGEIESAATVPIDSSDHFYASYRLQWDSSNTITINGVTYNNQHLLFVKYSPAHEILWVASMRYEGVGLRNSFIDSGFNPWPAQLSGPNIGHIELDQERNELFIVGQYLGDDEDTQVDLYNSDGRYSGLTTPRISPTAGTSTQIATFFALLSSSGEWLNLALTDHSGVGPEQVWTRAAALKPASPGKMLVLVAGYAQFGTNTFRPVVYPGGFSVNYLNQFRLASAWGVFDLATFQFDYLTDVRTSALITNSGFDIAACAVDSSRRSAVLTGRLFDANFNGVNSVSIPAVGGGSFVMNITSGGTGLRKSVLVVFKIDLATGDAYWAQQSSDTANFLLESFDDGYVWRYLIVSAAMDHFDRFWLSIRVFTRGAEVISLTYNNATVTASPSTDRAFYVLRISSRDGTLFDIRILELADSMANGPEFETSSFVRDSIGDVFLALRIGSRNIQIDSTLYSNSLTGGTVIVKFDGGNPTNIRTRFVYLNNFSELSFAIDSHDNIWAFHHQTVPGSTGPDTFGITGFGIAKLGQATYEPLGIVAANVAQGQIATVVTSGVVPYTSPTIWGTGRNLYNDHGTLSPDNTYGRTRIALVLNQEQIIVDMHRERITEPVR